jgi:hypothetical protein
MSPICGLALDGEVYGNESAEEYTVNSNGRAWGERLMAEPWTVRQLRSNVVPGPPAVYSITAWARKPRSSSRTALSLLCRAFVVVVALPTRLPGFDGRQAG